MTRRRFHELWRALVLITLSHCLTACSASSQSSYGSWAKYSPSERAWVAEKKKRFVFRNPLTKCVIRCRADVIKYRAVAADASSIQNSNNGAMKNGLVSTLPLSIPGAVLVLPGALVGMLLKEETKGIEYRAKGDNARVRKDLDDAVLAYLLALAHGDDGAGEPLSELWIERGKIEEAKQLRRMIACQGVSLSDEKWVKIETWLEEHGSPIEKCADDSTEPVEITWLE